MGRRRGVPGRKWTEEEKRKLSETKRGFYSDPAQREAQRVRMKIVTNSHGYVRSPTYTTWQAMKQRCVNPKHKDYARYGARGIVVCERWQLFLNFLEDMGIKPEETSIDRINNDGNYEPGNCRWATKSEQMGNRAPYSEATREKLRAATLAYWAEKRSENTSVS